MRKPDNAGHPGRPDEVTVRLPHGPGRAASAAPPPDEVTVLVPGALLAPAPTPDLARPGEAPVFVDDSGTRRRLLRLAGVLIALLSIGFIAVVGVALAVPSVATSVGLGNVVPFIVPGAAALPPELAPFAPRVPVVAPKPKPAFVAAPAVKPRPAAVVPPTTSPAVVKTSATVAPTPTLTPTATAPPVTTVTTAPGATVTDPPVQGGQPPVVPPAAAVDVVDQGAPAAPN